MADSITIARPYAKAIFEHALAAKKLPEWSKYLYQLASVVLDEQGARFIANPATDALQHSQLIMASIKTLKSDDAINLSHFVETLAENKRLMVLPEIMGLYDAMRAEQEKTQLVDVYSYSPLSAAQQTLLVSSLSKRLQRQVTLNIIIDKELIGGAVINAGDLVIDGSVRGALDKLRTGLAA